MAPRIGAALRRTRAQRPSDPTLAVTDLTLNTLTHEVRRAGALIEVSPTAFRLLCYLMLHQGKVITRTRLGVEIASGPSVGHGWAKFGGEPVDLSRVVTESRRDAAARWDAKASMGSSPSE